MLRVSLRSSVEPNGCLLAQLKDSGVGSNLLALLNPVVPDLNQRSNALSLTPLISCWQYQ